MKLYTSAGISVLAFSILALANPTVNLRDPFTSSDLGNHGVSTRPNIHFGPKTPRISPPPSRARTSTCNVKSHNDSITDDAPFIMDALKACNNGGHVIFTKGTNYTIGTAMNLTFLNSIDIGE